MGSPTQSLLRDKTMPDDRQSELPDDLQSPPETARWVILSFIAGLVVAALALEYYGYIHHPSKNDRATINELKLLSLKPEFDIKVSSKSSGKESMCVNGFLLLRPTNGKSVAGIVVDEKNRPMVCNLVEPPRPDSKAPARPPELQAAPADS